MKRRVLVLVVVGLVLFSGAAFSWAIGAAFGIQPLGGIPTQTMLSFQLPGAPIMWGVGLQAGGGRFALGVTADWWLIDQRLSNFVNVYLGPGLFLSLPDNFELGARLPVGVDIFPVNFLEFFVEVAPALLVFSSGANYVKIPDFRLQSSLGMRFWFR